MTPKQQAVIDRARASVPVFLTIERTRLVRRTAHDNFQNDHLNHDWAKKEFARRVSTWNLEGESK